MAEMSGEMKAADRLENSSDNVHHSGRTSCWEKLDVNAVFFLLLAQLCFRAGQHPPQSCLHPPPPSSWHNTALHLTRLGHQTCTHCLKQIGSVRRFAAKSSCYLAEEREAEVKERLPKGLARWGKKRERHQSEINARQSRLVSIKPVTVWV